MNVICCLGILFGIMQDIDDFDPLDDILLSDDEPPKLKINTKPTVTFQQAEDIDVDDESRKKKKKKMLAELFGSNQETSHEVKPPSMAVSITPSKSDWLDLKNDSSDKIVSSDLSLSTKNHDFEDEPRADSNIHPSSIFETTSTRTDRDVNEKTVHFVENNGTFSRRKSENSPAPETRKNKPRFKSLDLNLDLDFDSIPKKQSLTKSADIVIRPASTDDVLGESLYTPSLGLNRRLGSSKTRSSYLESRPSSSVVDPEIHQKFSLDLNRDTLPSWLEPKSEVKPTTCVSKSREISFPPDQLVSEKKDLEDYDKPVESKIVNHVNESESSNFVSVVSELVKKQEDFKQMAKSQVKHLSIQEQEIRNSALELMKQQRDSVKALMQILSVDDVLHGSSEESSTFFRANLENAVTQLQTKLAQLELEKAEVEMQLKHAECKNKIDLTMTENLCKYKLQIAEEKEAYFKNEIMSLQEEFDAKLMKRKVAEEELVRTYNEKIRILQEEHHSELKRVIELQNLKSSMGFNTGDKKSAEEGANKELTIREIAVEEKQKELMEFEERLNREKVALDSKKASMITRIEEFEMKIAKEKLNIEQQKKDLKLSQNIFSEKEMYWEREKQRERDYLSSCKQELEVLKENLLTDERKLMKERFEITAEKARMEAILTSEGSSGQIADVIQTRAELQGTIDEVRRLKSKLETERNEIRKEEMRLKEENWRLRNVEQELSLRHRHFQKLLQEVELKRDEGIRALKKAQLIESQMNERVENVEKRMMELNCREELLTKEKIELSKERDLLNKKKYQLDMILPQLSYDEQLSYSVLNKNLLDPRLMIMKLKAENDLSPLI